ncbi:transposable element Tcb2 transposase [Trichonephila clavipes]|nr:transposable element Tcb2 transposase [Trichonephila clavipes]
MDDNTPCHRTVAAEQLLESEDIEDACSSYLTTSNDSGAFDWRCKTEWAAMPQQLIDTLILSMGRRCETCLAVREIISPTKDLDVSLLDTHHRDVSGLQSHCAPCYFFNQAFYPSDFSFSKVLLTLHMSLRIGDLTVLNVLIWKAFVQSYIEKTVSSLIFAHQCI